MRFTFGSFLHSPTFDCTVVNAFCVRTAEPGPSIVTATAMGSALLACSRGMKAASARHSDIWCEHYGKQAEKILALHDSLSQTEGVSVAQHTKDHLQYAIQIFAFAHPRPQHERVVDCLRRVAPWTRTSVAQDSPSNFKAAKEQLATDLALREAVSRCYQWGVRSCANTKPPDASLVRFAFFQRF